MSAPSLLEKYLYAVRKGGLRTAKAVDFSAAPVLYIPTNTIVGGVVTYPGGVPTVVGGSPIGAGGFTNPITSSAAQALTVGPNGLTNPVFNVDASVASAVTGLTVQGQAAGGGLILQTTSSGANEPLSILSKGTGTFTFGTAAAPAQVLGSGTISTPGSLNVGNGVAITAGGSQVGLKISSVNFFGVFVGSGAPTISAAQGSLYLRSDGSSTSTRLYVNTNGTTGWTNLTSAT